MLCISSKMSELQDGHGGQVYRGTRVEDCEHVSENGFMVIWSLKDILMRL